LLEKNKTLQDSSLEPATRVALRQIKDFARTLAFSGDFKIIFLDECDALTSDAQQALRRTMEKYTKTCRFVLSCNYSSRIIEPLQSRCVIFRFRPLASKDVEARLSEIAKKEKLQLDKKAVAGKLKFILPERIGAVRIRKDISEKSITGLLQT